MPPSRLGTGIANGSAGSIHIWNHNSSISNAQIRVDQFWPSLCQSSIVLT